MYNETDLRSKIERLQAALEFATFAADDQRAKNAKLREAGECALYALEHPESDQMFAIRALHEALAAQEDK